MIYRIGDYVTATVRNVGTAKNGWHTVIEGRICCTLDDGTYLVGCKSDGWLNGIINCETDNLQLIRRPELEELLTDDNKRFREYAQCILSKGYLLGS